MGGMGQYGPCIARKSKRLVKNLKCSIEHFVKFVYPNLRIHLVHGESSSYL